MKIPTLFRSVRPMLLGALILSIPAFYLVLSGPNAYYRHAGHWLYGLLALMLAFDIMARRKDEKPMPARHGIDVDILIFVGALGSAWPTETPWTVVEWFLRLGLCALVFIRFSLLLAKFVLRYRVLHICMLAVALLAISGAGFYWLEPRVLNYADGLWLAFVTGATVGYGDVVPSTPASRIFAVFIVLLGYALFSIVTASIAALFVGEDEKRLRRELHADIRILRNEIVALRAELHAFIIEEERDAGGTKGKQ